MYKVILSNNGVEYTIHNSSSNNTVSKLSSGNITMEINSIPSFEFTMLPNNTGFTRLTPYITRIIVENEVTGEEVFNGRVLKIKPKMSSKGAISKTVICEGRLGFLCDSIQPYLEEQHWDTDDESTGLQKYLEYLLEVHNSQVDEDKKVYLGKVTATTLYNDNSCDKGTNYETTWSVINSKLIDIFGGELQLREVDGLLYLDYLEEIGEESDTVIELTKNMQSIDETIDYSEVFTRLIPLGAKLTTEDENGNEIETEERLTIASVNNQSIWIDTDKINELGVIVKTVEFDDITDASNLLESANDYIDTQEVVTEKNNISVVDLSLIDSSYDELTVGNYYNVKNTLIELNKQLRITKKSLDICKPTSSSITVGDTGKTLSEITLGKAKDITDVLQQITYITTNYAKNTAVTNTYSQLSSLINQTYQEILLLVSETYVTSEDYLEKMAELDIYIDQITAMVSEITNLTEQYATIELTLNSINETVANLSDQSTQIASITLTLEEIQAQITSITDLTVSDTNIGSISLADVNESTLIYLHIEPTSEDVSYLYHWDDLYYEDDLYYKSRDVYFVSDDETVTYTLPCNLWYLDSNTYDEFVYSYETQTCYKISRVGFDENMEKYALDEEVITYYDFELINLSGGNYTIYMPTHDTAKINARAMVSNLYTDQYVTQAQLSSSLSVLEQSINASVEAQYTTFEGELEELSAELSIQATEIDLKLDATDLTSSAIISLINNRDGTSTALINASNINLTASDVINLIAGNTINLTSNSIVISSTNFSVTEDGAITATSGTIGGFTISAYNLIGGSGTSTVGMCSTNGQNYAFWAGSSTSSSAPFRVGHDGSLYASNASITGSITATSGSFTGKIYASSGTIADIVLDSSGIYRNNGDYGWGIWGTTNMGNYAMHIGANTSNVGSAPFRVTYAGKLYATNAEISGTVSSSTISSSTFSSGSININNYFSVNSSGGTQLSTSGGGFLSTLVTTHPYVSALNIAYGAGGLQFKNGTKQSSVGDTTYAEIYITNSYNICVGANYGIWLYPGSSNYAYCGSSCSSSTRIAVSSSGPSSLNVKKNLVNIENQYDNLYKDLQKINMYNFDYKYKGIKDYDSDYGFIIDELENTNYISKFIRNYNLNGKIEDGKLIPYDENENIEDYSFNYKEWDRDAYIKLLFILVKTLQNKIDKLESEVK